MTRWRKSGEAVSSLVTLVNRHLLSPHGSLTRGADGTCGDGNHKASAPLFLKHCNHKSSYHHNSPWGQFDLEANNFEKAQSTNIENSTLSRGEKGPRIKNSIY